MKNYESIINLKHFEPKYHKRMTTYNRSAQFAPFAALTGYNESVKETARLTDNKIELNDDLKFFINMKLQLLEEHIKDKPNVKVLYFEKDKRKSGGKYIQYEGYLKRIDKIEKELIFIDKHKVNFDFILDINFETYN